MIQRSGQTLVEVLVAIFIMSIGLMALLSLFPLGAINMAQSIKDERTAHIAANADAFADFMGIRTDTNVINAFQNPPSPYQQPSTSGPSYPVYVDPAGAQLLVNRVGQNTCINRVTLSFINTSNVPRQIPRWFSLLDDMAFDENGMADTSSGTILRPGDYTWAYLLRELQYLPTGTTGNPQVDLTVVVYYKRAPEPTGTGLAGEDTYSATFQAGSNVVYLNYGSNPSPTLRKGSWILDATYS
ncbi:MAG: prepilin-type N-terminal cleavage/methylation domain-containing protein, partial [Planctomycetes bacterium]|nr:prepilin-type N-terminal cleavage/methylation domain-containing protein [Planctomycetota bacterium]